VKHIDLQTWRKVLVTGDDAIPWLDDLISAGVSGLRDGESRQSLLLTPTGRIRAHFHVAMHDGAALLLQDPIQPRAIADLLAPYVLSSKVEMVVQDELRVFAVPAGDELRFAFGRPEGEPADYGTWCIKRGIPRFGVDLDEESLPQEAGWERFIDFTKGCFMGQEAMAKIQNFGGHPNRVVLARRSSEPVNAGEAVLTDGEEVGLVTSAAGRDLIARVAWRSRDARLQTSAGVELSDRA